jgi:hypothetical protein
MRARRRSSGFTLLEVAITSVVFLGLLAAFVAAHKTTREFTDRTYAEMRVNEEQQRNLAALADLLRGASASSLTGFDATGASTAPSFQSVTGADATGRILGPVQSIAWRPSSTPANDPANAGEIALDVGGVKVVIAPHVPVGGFVVRKSGNTLRVTLTTTYATSDRTTASVTGDVSVSLRN